MKFIRAFLLVLIIVGIILLFTQKFWVPKLVDKILKYQQISIVNLVATSTKNLNQDLQTVFNFPEYISKESYAGWNIYKDTISDSGFALPSGWAVTPNDEKILILSPADRKLYQSNILTDQPIGITLYRYKNDSVTSNVEDWIKKYYKTEDLTLSLIKLKPKGFLVDSIDKYNLNSSNFYLLHESGVGEGEYIIFREVGDFVYKIIVFNKQYLDDPVFIKMLGSISTSIEISNLIPIIEYDGSVLPLPNIQFIIPDGWYFHPNGNFIYLTQKEAFKNNISTEDYAYGLNIKFYVIRMVKTSVDYFINELYKNEMTISVSTTTIQGYPVVRTQYQTQEYGGNETIDYFFYDGKAYAFSLYYPTSDADARSNFPNQSIINILEKFRDSTISKIIH